MTRFSQLYLIPAELSRDSKRMRVRLTAAARDTIPAASWHTLFVYLQRRLGVRVEGWAALFERAELRDVLDGVTAVYDWYLRRAGYRDNAVAWRDEVRTILKEEHVGYRLDDNAVAHFAVDEEFERSRAIAVAALNDRRYTGARTEFEAAYDALAGSAPDGKRAIRGVFEANEIVFKLMFPDAQRLAGAQLGQYLTPHVESAYASAPAAASAAKDIARAFTGWVASAQWYRHGQGQEEPHEPPLETAVLIVSAGAAFLRWLLQLDTGAQRAA
jgi:hypothetical protein